MSSSMVPIRATGCVWSAMTRMSVSSPRALAQSRATLTALSSMIVS